MDTLYKQFAEEYENSVDTHIYNGDDQKSASSPILFLFIGDKITDGLKAVYENMEKKCCNSKGIVFFQVYSDKVYENENVYNLKVAKPNSESKTLRKDIFDSFHENENLLMDLNKRVLQIKNRILECGKMFTNSDRINISVVTRVDDPLNVILPQIVILLKLKLLEHFKVVYADLFQMVLEKNEEEDYAYSFAVSMSFFKEIEYIQSKDFVFNEPIEVLKEGVRLPVTTLPGTTVFDIVYILSDKNRKGIITKNILEENYEIISCISLLKNTKIDMAFQDSQNQYYDNNQFKLSIQDKGERQPYASAGFSKVKRPNFAIAIMVLKLLYDSIIHKMKKPSEIEDSELLRIFDMDEKHIDYMLQRVMQNITGINEMNAIMPVSGSISPWDIEGKTFEDAEKLMYGDACARFFQRNLVEPAESSINAVNLESDIRSMLQRNILLNKSYGLYCGFLWTGDDRLLRQLMLIEKNTNEEIEKLQDNIGEFYRSKVEFNGILKLPIYRKRAIQDFRTRLIEYIYSNKLQLLKLKLKLKHLKQYREIIEKCHNELKKEIDNIDNLGNSLSAYARNCINNEDEYIGQNIKEYYEEVVEYILKKYSTQYGENYYFEDFFLGNAYESMTKNIENFFKKVIYVCRKYVLSTEYFMKPFEEELHQRASVSVEYGNNKILTKEEIYKKIYSILEDNACENIYLMDYNVQNTHGEKYFFGDYNSEFIKYAFESDKNVRTYRLGCIHEKRTSGIEKLNLMGGFNIQDVMYGKNCMKYYKVFIEEGFELHGKDKEKLPEIKYYL